jgi:uncharacterized Zn-binding protein involved in type VI secretion
VDRPIQLSKLIGDMPLPYRLPSILIRIESERGKIMAEIIRQGDPTSHGGKVLEGSLSDICMGKPIAFMGHKVSCPTCKGIFPIAEGAPNTTFYGRGVALAGMKTACGATLIATQFTDTVEYGGGASAAAKSNASGRAATNSDATSTLDKAFA